MVQAQQDRVASTLSCLAAISGPSPVADNYSSFKRFCAEHSVSYFGQFLGEHWYVRLDISPDRFAAIRRELAAQDAADAASVKAALYQLWLMTRHERLSDDDRDAKIAIFAKSLQLYDRGPVLLALSEFAREDAWFPSWADMAGRVERHMGEVGTLLMALRLQIAERTT